VLLPNRKKMKKDLTRDFPDTNTAEDGYITSAPVASFPPNGYGLFDMSGYVWEWTSDWYRPDYYQTLADRDVAALNPQGPSESFDPTPSKSPVCRSASNEAVHFSAPINTARVTSRAYAARENPAPARTTSAFGVSSLHLGSIQSCIVTPGGEIFSRFLALVAVPVLGCLSGAGNPNVAECAGLFGIFHASAHRTRMSCFQHKS